VFNQGEGDNGKKKKNSILRLPTERMTWQVRPLL
jgi:hypothetical protein